MLDPSAAVTFFRAYEAIRRPRAEAVLKMSRRADKAAQLASPLGWRPRNVIVRLLPAWLSAVSSSRSSATSCDEHPRVAPQRWFASAPPECMLGSPKTLASS
jgi:hypothetical protein